MILVVQLITLPVLATRREPFSRIITICKIIPFLFYWFSKFEWHLQHDISFSVDHVSPVRRTRETEECHFRLKHLKTRYMPAKCDSKLPPCPWISLPEKPRKQDTRLKNKIGINFGSHFPSPLMCTITAFDRTQNIQHGTSDRLLVVKWSLRQDWYIHQENSRRLGIFLRNPRQDPGTATTFSSFLNPTCPLAGSHTTINTWMSWSKGQNRFERFGLCSVRTLDGGGLAALCS